MKEEMGRSRTGREEEGAVQLPPASTQRSLEHTLGPCSNIMQDEEEEENPEIHLRKDKLICGPFAKLLLLGWKSRRKTQG